MNPSPILESALTCPHCGHAAAEVMPTDACLHFFECPGGHGLLRPKPGDCCVFCSFGSVKCPPVQLSGRCCVGTAEPAERGAGERADDHPGGA